QRRDPSTVAALGAPTLHGYLAAVVRPSADGESLVQLQRLHPQLRPGRRRGVLHHAADVLGRASLQDRAADSVAPASRFTRYRPPRAAEALRRAPFLSVSVSPGRLAHVEPSADVRRLRAAGAGPVAVGVAKVHGNPAAVSFD